MYVRQLKVFMEKGCENFIPRKAHPDDACFDIFSSEDIVIPAGSFRAVHTGLHMEVPKGCEVVFRGRSGMACKHGIIAHMGTIDYGYTDECKVILYNMSDKDYTIHIGDRIAQFKLQEVLPVYITQVNKLDVESRGGGFGSSGV